MAKLISSKPNLHTCIITNKTSISQYNVTEKISTVTYKPNKNNIRDEKLL